MSRLFVVSGPSGAGVSEILASLLAQRTDIGSVTPITARKMRKGEENGVGFWFYDLDGWANLLSSGDMLEHTVFAGNDYGTSRRLVQEQLQAGKNVVLSLEVDRAAQIKANLPEAVCIYIAPSSPAILRARYEQTARSKYEVEVRMQAAEAQARLASFCDFEIPSDDYPAAVEALNTLIDRLA